MAARFRSMFAFAARVCCVLCHREFSLTGFAGHHLNCADG